MNISKVQQEILNDGVLRIQNTNSCSRKNTDSKELSFKSDGLSKFSRGTAEVAKWGVLTIILSGLYKLIRFFGEEYNNETLNLLDKYTTLGLKVGFIGVIGLFALGMGYDAYIARKRNR